MAKYPPQIEQWRPLVSKYFPAQLVDKALWVIMFESNGNFGAVGDGGAARGLFQIQDNRNFAGRPNAAWLDNPENNIKYAAQVLGAANNKWTDWGEGSLYNGKRFGALGNHPYPGNQALNSRGSTSSGIQFTGDSDMVQVEDGTSNPFIQGAITQLGLANEKVSNQNETSQDMLDFNGNGIPDWMESGSSDVDHFFDVNPLAGQQHQLNIDMFNYQKSKDAWFANLQQSEFEWQKAMDERDYALAVGELDLARQKAMDANHWQQQTLQLELQMANLDAQVQTYNTNMQYQAAMAQATNDADRNRINLAHEQEQAAIAKMQDETTRAIAGKQLNIEAYNGETNRMLGLGDLAIRNNEFLHALYSNPRDHYSLFAMQRGYTPDWDTLAATGSLPEGQRLSVKDPFSQMTPTVEMPTDFNIGPGQSHGQVGQASSGVQMQGISQYQNMPMQQAPQLNMDFGTPPQVPKTPPGGSGSYTDINPGGAQGGVPAAMLKPGLNLATIGPVNGQGIYGSSFNTGTAFYDQGMTRPIGEGDYLNPYTQVWINYGQGAPQAPGYPQPPTTSTVPASGSSGQISPHSGGIPTYTQGPPQQPGQAAMPPEYVPGMPAYAEGTNGMVNDTMFMTGDSASSNPFAGGAKPEVLFNPTGAPFGVFNSEQVKQMDFGSGRGFDMPKPMGLGNTMQFPRQNWSNMFSQFQMPQQRFRGQMPQFGMPMNQFGMYSGMDYGTPTTVPQVPQNIAYNQGAGVNTNPQGGARQDMVNKQHMLRNRQYQFQHALGRAGSMPMPTRNQSRSSFRDDPMRYNQGTMPRYATGTMSNSGGMQPQGGDPLTIPNSSNPWAENINNIPSRAKMLMDYGMPMAPGVLNAISGNTNNPNNVASAVSQRGGGVLPSLQTMRGMSPDELLSLQGFYNGPVGIGWSNIVDYITGATRGLGRAQTSGGIRNA